MKRLLLPILIGVLTVSSCKKNETASAAKTLTANATVVNSGEIAADGCGWLIKLDDGAEFSPVNLPANFQQDNLKVNISYTQLSTNAACGSVANNPGVRQIQINNIEKGD